MCKSTRPVASTMTAFANGATRTAGPCAACVQELRSTFRGEARVIEGDDYVPKTNVTPNAIAVRDD